MADSPDPLGKRALFWAPAQRHDGEPLVDSRRGQRHPEEQGRRALFSTTDPEAVGAGASADAPRPAGRPDPASAGHGARRAGAGASVTGWLQQLVDRAGHVARPPVGGILGQVHLQCGACGAHSRVDVVQSVLRSLPFPLVRPGRGFTHLLTCPACQRRTWVSASWRPWRR